MKKFFFPSVLGLFSIFSFSSSSAKNINKADAPSATFDKLWIDYNVYDGGVKGMRIHVKFTAYDMYNMDAYLAIYFQYDDEVGGWLKDKNNKYNSSEGEVAVYKNIKPLYNPAVYDNLDVFMPYDELDLDPGEYDLALDVKIIYKAGGLISKLTTYYFDYSEPGSTTTTGGAPGSKITATFKEMWVDFDIYQDNQKGMKIHAKFSVANMKNIDGYLALYFETKDGVRLKSNNTNYRSSSGQLAVYQLVVPSYDETDYNDLALFIPYSEINVASGRNDLKIDADLIYKAGGMIQHLKYYDFWINK